jgi:hypothetical protein
VLPERRELVLDYIVERKRMDDLCSSIKDGRFKEQKVYTSWKICDGSGDLRGGVTSGAHPIGVGKQGFAFSACFAVFNSFAY